MLLAAIGETVRPKNGSVGGEVVVDGGVVVVVGSAGGGGGTRTVAGCDAKGRSAMDCSR